MREAPLALRNRGCPLVPLASFLCVQRCTRALAVVCCLPLSRRFTPSFLRRRVISPDPPPVADAPPPPVVVVVDAPPPPAAAAAVGARGRRPAVALPLLGACKRLRFPC